MSKKDGKNGKLKKIVGKKFKSDILKVTSGGRETERAGTEEVQYIVTKLVDYVIQYFKNIYIFKKSEKSRVE